MNRLYGNHTCLMCGKVPSIGWLYVCQQDRDVELERSETIPDPEGFVIVPSEASYFDAQSRLAESLGMSVSVVNGIRKRDYSLEQVDKLIGQKQRLIATIRRQETPSTDSTPQPHRAAQKYQPATDSIIASLGAKAGAGVQAVENGNPAHRAADTLTSATASQKLSRSRKQSCNFQVCHSCRPFFQDRLYTSFEKVFSGNMPAITENEIVQLPLLDPAVVRALGLRAAQAQPPPTPFASYELSSGSIRQGDGYDEDTSDW